MQVRELMTSDPACCTPESTLQEVAQMMETNDCGLIPVVDSMAGMRPVGTVTDRDIAIRAVAAGGNPGDMKASEIMTTDVATVVPEMHVNEVFALMEEREIRRVLVVDEQGKCCGIVAQADVVQSNANPVRTNKVIREISESSPSRNDTGYYRGYLPSSLSSSKYVSTGFLSPFLIGLGSGAAISYMFNKRQNSSRCPEVYGHGSYDISPAVSMDTTNEENFGRYVDAEQEIERRQQNIEERVHTLKTDSSSPLGTISDDRSSEKDKGRSATQGLT
jgi:CBS domain-containing protein